MTKYEHDLRKIVDEIADEWEGFGNRALADAAGLHHVTVWRLMSGATTYPRFQTIWKLAKAVGMEIHLTKARQARRVA